MFIIAALALLSLGCSMQKMTDATPLEPGKLRFAGHTWSIKSSDTPVGPGPNRFSDKPSDIYVDDEGQLHLTLRPVDGHWYATELVSDFQAGYGRYEIIVGPGVDTLDPNVVLGIFTWDHHTYLSDANTEIDIEWARWGNPERANLHYTMHPARNEHVELHPERTTSDDTDLEQQGVSHVIDWRPDRVTCASYLGTDGPDPKRLLSAWTYHGSLHPPRRTGDGEQLTDWIGVVRPSPTTSFRFNLWLLDTNRDGQVDPPTDGQPVHVVIKDFSYTPY
ncbi:glycoside hydrolase family 16 protein [Mucisphaera sp.]|uniref:glycoside hydrolase family 16 protein n=1 Tax=Mucisphaera sp. TaxID=2913024 RepID=UPI003D14C2F8